ncbi:MAG: hypothetical protein ACFCVG_05245, partial [Kineosporiaceae bacterium]
MTPASPDPARSARPLPRDGSPDADGDVLDERVSALVVALQRPADPGELRAEANMMAAFAESGPATGLVGAAERTTRTVRAARWGAAAAAAGTLTLGTAAAAWTGTLPGPWQQAAHQVVGAPAVERVADLPTGPPGGSAPAVSAAGRAIGSEPEIPGSAVPGLCAAHGAGELPVQSQAHRALAEAAGEAGIDDFCAEVERAGSAGDASDRRRDGPAEP